jgi:hypothetical protein
MLCRVLYQCDTLFGQSFGAEILVNDLGCGGRVGRGVPPHLAAHP